MSATYTPVARAATALVAAVAFAAFLAFPNAVPDNTLDASWSAAFAYFFRERLLAGVDYIFTYGPLGFLLTAYYDPPTFLWKWLYEVLLKAYIVYEIVRLSRLSGIDGVAAPWWRGLVPLCVAAVLWAFSVYPGFVYTTDAWAYVVFLVLATAPVVDRELSAGRVLATVLIVAVLSLAKATLTVLALPVIVVCALRVGARVPKPPVWKSPLFLFPAVWLCLWFLLGQGVVNIGAYFVGSFSVASGYNEAMAFATPEYRNSAPPLAAALVALLCLLVALRVQRDVLVAIKRETVLQTVYLLLVALLLLLSWKHGFTRGGNHTLITFMTLGFAGSFLWAVLPGGAKGRVRGALLSVATACALFGALRGDADWFHTDPSYPPVIAGLRALLNPIGTARDFAEKRDANKVALALPEVRRVVGTEPVGIWSYEQGVLLLNGLNYRPHPSFQGYSSYTRYLQEKDLAFWASETAPPFLLFKPQTIDLRYPNLDGGPAFAGLLLRYAPVLTENGYFLMKRRDLVVPLGEILAARDAATVATVAAGTWIAVPPAPPNTLQLVSITLKPTLAGFTRRTLFKPAEALLAFRSEEGAEPRVVRLPPVMARQGFVLNPRLQNESQVAMLYGGTLGPSPATQITVALPPDAEPCFAPEIDVRFFAVPFAPTLPEGNP